MGGTGSGPRPLGDTPMTPAERMAKWRAKHARRVARRTPYVPTPWRIDEWTEKLTPKLGELTFRLDDE
jgi:hypothetical protein